MKKVEQVISDLLCRFLPSSSSVEINELICNYYSSLTSVLQVRKSAYINVPNYQSYTYIIYNKLTWRFYIGVRYTAQKYSNNVIEDLKCYQSSSRNKNFKRDLELNPFNYELEVIETFSNEFEAIHFEALLHQIYKVDVNENCYNLTKETFPNTSFYSICMYDLKRNKTFNYSDINSSRVMENLRRLSTNASKDILVLNRYCLYENIKFAKVTYEKQNTLHTMYKFNESQNVIESFTRPYHWWNKKLKHYNVERVLLKDERYFCIQGYYVNKDKCSEEYEYHTLFVYDCVSETAIPIQKRLCEWRTTLHSGFKNLLVYKRINQIYNYYRDMEECINDHKLYYWYRYDKVNNNVVTSVVRNKDNYKTIGCNYYKVVKGTSRSMYGWYLDIKECIKDYTIIKLEHINNLTTMEVYYCEGSSLIGHNFTSLVKGTLKTYKGYRIKLD